MVEGALRTYPIMSSRRKKLDLGVDNSSFETHMKPTTRILSYLAIMAVVVSVFGITAPDTGGYRSVGGWIYVLCAFAACVGLIVSFEILHYMWRKPEPAKAANGRSDKRRPNEDR